MSMLSRILMAGALLCTATAVQADCLSDFNKLNHANADVGPYESVTTLKVSNAGQDLGSVIVKGQLIWPDRMRMLLDSPAKPELRTDIIIIKDKGWQAKGGSQWQPMSSNELNGMNLTEAQAEGFLNGELKNVTCLGSRQIGVRSVLAFSVERQTNGIGVPITMNFDETTKRPLSAEGSIAASGVKLEFHAEFHFDPAISIQPPLGG